MMLYVLSCNNTGTGNPKAKGPEPLFVFSKNAPVSGYQNPADWCFQPFSAAMVVSLDKVNPNIRQFSIDGEGVYKFVVEYGKLASSFIVRRKGAGEGLELFTSNQYPYCLSNHANFQIEQDGRAFKYDSPMPIDYRVEYQPVGNGGILRIEFPVGVYYGLLGRRCNACE